MPRRRGETNNEWMERLRAFRRSERDDLFLAVAGAQCMTQNVMGGQRPGVELQAFMSIFHPDHALAGTPEGLTVSREMDETARRNR